MVDLLPQLLRASSLAQVPVTLPLLPLRSPLCPPEVGRRSSVSPVRGLPWGEVGGPCPLSQPLATCPAMAGFLASSCLFTLSTRLRPGSSSVVHHLSATKFVKLVQLPEVSKP